MGERPLVHLVDGYGGDTACGKPWRDATATLIRSNTTCPACRTAFRLTRPTVLTMSGETGEDECGLLWIYAECGTLDLCPAPTPEAS